MMFVTYNVECRQTNVIYSGVFHGDTFDFYTCNLNNQKYMIVLLEFPCEESPNHKCVNHPYTMNDTEVTSPCWIAGWTHTIGHVQYPFFDP